MQKGGKAVFPVTQIGGQHSKTMGENMCSVPAQYGTDKTLALTIRTVTRGTLSGPYRQIKTCCCHGPHLSIFDPHKNKKHIILIFVLLSTKHDKNVDQILLSHDAVPLCDLGYGFKNVRWLCSRKLLSPASGF